MAEVVVGVDGSEASRAALRTALGEAASRGVALRVLHSWRSIPSIGAVAGFGYPMTPYPVEDLSAWAKQLVEDMLTSAVADTHTERVQIVPDVRAGDAGTELVAASTLAEVLVVGARRHGALASAVIGSATNYVLHHAQCPVMVVPAGVDAAARWDRVVVGVDGSDCGASALRWAAAQAKAHDCPLVVVHTWELVTDVNWYSGNLTSRADYGEQVESWVREHVAETLPDAQDLTLEVRVRQDYACAGLVAEAGPHDLLVVGSRGRGGFADLLLGSVALQVAHHARSAVVVLRKGTGPTP